MAEELDLTRADPKNLIRESFRIDGITPSECRSIFVDWALALPEGVDSGAAMRLLLDTYAPKARLQGEADHPMIGVLTEGQKVAAQPPRRRGGRAARFEE